MTDYSTGLRKIESSGMTDKNLFEVNPAAWARRREKEMEISRKKQRIVITGDYETSGEVV